MQNTYIKTQDVAKITMLTGFCRNMLGPVQGRAATEQTIDDYGNVIPAQEALGDPSYYYACITAPDGFADALLSLPSMADVEVCTEENISNLVGSVFGI